MMPLLNRAPELRPPPISLNITKPPVIGLRREAPATTTDVLLDASGSLELRSPRDDFPELLCRGNGESGHLVAPLRTSPSGQTSSYL